MTGAEAPSGAHEGRAAWIRSRGFLSVSAFATALVSGFAVASWATRPSFGAKFGPIDDHEPLIWMGRHHHLPWSQFWSTFVDRTEVGQWGGSGRFRPAYYLLRVAEAALFGDNPSAWYAAVLVMFAGTCAILGYVAAIWLSTAVETGRLRRPVMLAGSAAGTLVFAGLYAWSGIVARLGPSELPGLLATSVVLLSLTKLSLGGGRSWWIAALVGVTTAVFAKESFVSLALAFPLVGAHSYVAFGRRRIDLAAGLLGLVPAALLVAILAPDLLHAHRDVYGTGVGGGRLSAALSGFTRPPLSRSLVAVGVALLAWSATAVTMRKTERRVPAFLLAVILWLVACLFLDAWFYDGTYPLPRYRAISDLTFTVLLIGAACLSIFAVRNGRRQGRRVLVLTTTSLIVSSLFVAELVPLSVSHLRGTRRTAVDHAATSREYQRGLSEALDRVAAEAKPTVAVVATSAGDYEPAYAVLNELGRRSGDRFHEYLIVASAGSQGTLGAMASISRKGSPDWHTRPVGELAGAGSTQALCIFLNQPPRPVRGCRRGDGIRLVAEGM